MQLELTCSIWYRMLQTTHSGIDRLHTLDTLGSRELSLATGLVVPGAGFAGLDIAVGSMTVRKGEGGDGADRRERLIGGRETGIWSGEVGQDTSRKERGRACTVDFKEWTRRRGRGRGGGRKVATSTNRRYQHLLEPWPISLTQYIPQQHILSPDRFRTLLGWPRSLSPHSSRSRFGHSGSEISGVRSRSRLREMWNYAAKAAVGGIAGARSHYNDWCG